MPKWLLKRPGRCLNIKDFRVLQPGHTFLFNSRAGRLEDAGLQLQLLLLQLEAAVTSRSCVCSMCYVASTLLPATPDATLNLLVSCLTHTTAKPPRAAALCCCSRPRAKTEHVSCRPTRCWRWNLTAGQICRGKTWAGCLCRWLMAHHDVTPTAFKSYNFHRI